ncbi:MAG: paraquat-inducible protein A, partial [Bacteroidales bacterium]|nr:paraquat-inducible protein A [Bacteroidales bacterium]
ILLLVSAVFLVNLVTIRKINLLQATLLILASFCLLLGGITTPMIDLEARIDQLMLQVLGEEIIFRNNILYFQSKSITDVVRILFEERTLPMIFVGVLVFTFSIIFPSLKLISSLLYTYRIGNLRENRLIRFFVIKSGKWSMADVMVVAIFMAFIGFNGIIGSQLDQLTRATEPVEIFTTNGTQLLAGFYLFLLFCISSLLLSETVTRKT